MMRTMSPAVQAPEAPRGEIRAARLSTRRLLAMNAMWLGQGAHWPPISFQLVPVAAFMIAGASADLLIGRVSAAGNLFALVAPGLPGRVGARPRNRWGKRRPWTVAGPRG